MIPVCHNPFKFDVVTFNEVRTVIIHLSSNNSCDTYRINLEITGTLTSIITVPLTKLLNMCITSSILPDVFKLSKVIPVFQICSRDDSNNYRPISLIAILGKLLKAALKKTNL